MSKTAIAGVIIAIIFAGALGFAGYNAGQSSGREQSQQDRIEDRLREMDERLVKLEHWRDRWGTHGAAGATP